MNKSLVVNYNSKLYFFFKIIIYFFFNFFFFFLLYYYYSYYLNNLLMDNSIFKITFNYVTKIDQKGYYSMVGHFYIKFFNPIIFNIDTIKILFFYKNTFIIGIPIFKCFWIENIFIISLVIM